MAPRILIQDTIEYNQKINLIRKMFKSKKYPKSLLSLKLTRSPQSGSSAKISVEPIKSSCNLSSSKVSVKPIKSSCNLSSSKGQGRPQVTKESQDKCDQVLYTSLAEERENYETLLLLIRPSGLNTSRGNISPKSINSCRGNIRFKKPKGTKRSNNQDLYTPMAELRRNYETLLSWI